MQEIKRYLKMRCDRKPKRGWAEPDILYCADIEQVSLGEGLRVNEPIGFNMLRFTKTMRTTNSTYEKMAERMHQCVQRARGSVVMVDDVLDSRLYSRSSEWLKEGLRFVFVTGQYVRRDQINRLQSLLSTMPNGEAEFYIKTGVPFLLNFVIVDSNMALIHGPHLHIDNEIVSYEVTTDAEEIKCLRKYYLSQRGSLVRARAVTSYTPISRHRMRELLQDNCPRRFACSGDIGPWIAESLEQIRVENERVMQAFDANIDKLAENCRVTDRRSGIVFGHASTAKLVPKKPREVRYEY